MRKTLLAFLVAASIHPVHAQEDVLKHAVVAIRDANNEVLGAGVIVGANKQRVFVATAEHVVHEDGFTVEFFAARGEPYRARLLPETADVDFAVVAVDVPADDAIRTDLPTLPYRVGSVPRETKVWNIGHSDGVWEASSRLNVVQSELVQTFTFSNVGILQGSSGGPLFDDHDRLIGIVIEVSGARGKALMIEPLVRLLKLWDVPTSLLSAGSVGPTFKTAAFKSAVDDVRAGKVAPSKFLFVSWGEFMTAAGEHFVPVSLYVPESAGLTARAALTFYGMVENASGTPVAVFEEPATLTASRGGFFFDKSLKLSPGNYKGTFGLARDGKPLSTASTEINILGIDKNATGISSLILSADFDELKEAQQPTAPFTFRDFKVVPKGDRTFRTSQDLWWLLELRNPGIDAVTKQPKVFVKQDMTGKTAEGRNVNLDGPPIEWTRALLPVTGVPEHFIVMGSPSSFQPSRIDPGDYTLTITVMDQVKSWAQTVSGAFKVVE